MITVVLEKKKPRKRFFAPLFIKKVEKDRFSICREGI